MRVGNSVLPNNGNSFNTLRLLAAFAVLLSHSFPLAGLHEPALGGLSSVGNPYSAGTMAVLVFFAISGYLITESWVRDPNLGRFFVRRSLRIFPGLIFVIFVTALVLGPILTSIPLGEYFSDFKFREYFLNLILIPKPSLPGVFLFLPYPDTVNGPLWTLRHEFFMYAVVAGLGVLGWTHERSRTLAITLFLGVVWCVVVGVYFNWPLIGRAGLHEPKLIMKTIEMGAPFMVGAVMYLYRDKSIFSYRVLFLLLIAFIASSMFDGSGVVKALGWIVIPYVSIVVGLFPPKFLSVIRFRSDISYGVYIYAWPVQQTISLFFLDQWGWLRCTALCLLITTLCAWISWSFVEKRALSFKPKRKVELDPVTIGSVLTQDAN